MRCSVADAARAPARRGRIHPRALNPRCKHIASSAQVRDSLTARAKEFNILVDDIAITHLSFGTEVRAAPACAPAAWLAMCELRTRRSPWHPVADTCGPVLLQTSCAPVRSAWTRLCLRTSGHVSFVNVAGTCIDHWRTPEARQDDADCAWTEPGLFSRRRAVHQGGGGEAGGAAGCRARALCGAQGRPGALAATATKG